MVATGFLGLVPLGADPRLPADTAWHPVDAAAADRARPRRRSSTGRTAGCRPSCRTPTSVSRWLPPTFTIAELRRVYATALAHDVDPTNLQRILTRRGMLEPTGTTAPPGRRGGRPAAMYRFTAARAAGDRSVRRVPATAD